MVPFAVGRDVEQESPCRTPISSTRRGRSACTALSVCAIHSSLSTFEMAVFVQLEDALDRVHGGRVGERGIAGIGHGLAVDQFPFAGLVVEEDVFLAGALTRHHVGDEPPVARDVLAQHGRARLDHRVLHERRFHLAQFDAVAAHLHLLVDTAEVFQLAAGAPAREVSGAVDALARAERVGHEALLRQVGPVEEPAAKPRLRRWSSPGIPTGTRFLSPSST